MNKCDSIKRLDSNFNYLIKYALENSIKKGYLPMKFETLKEKNRALYDSVNIDKKYRDVLPYTLSVIKIISTIISVLYLRFIYLCRELISKEIHNNI